MLIVNKLSFSYTKEKNVIQSLSFNLNQGDMVALVGESGSGKSTILKLIYGMLDWDEGEIIYNNKRLQGRKGSLVPGEADFKYLEQDFGLTSYATVGENVGVFLSNINLEEKKERVKFLLSLVEMDSYIDEKPVNLSGGQQQRVALIKALAQRPSLLLLDEPFSQVDTFKKNVLKRAVFDFAKENNISIIVATHEVEDALAFADKMVIIKDGKVVQEDKPNLIYDNPANEYVANLFGENNILNKKDFPDLFEGINEEKILIYPYQFKISNDGLCVKILKSYFTKGGFLIEAFSRMKKFWFINSDFISTGDERYIQFDSYHIFSE